MSNKTKDAMRQLEEKVKALGCYSSTGRNSARQYNIVNLEQRIDDKKKRKNIIFFDMFAPDAVKETEEDLNDESLSEKVDIFSEDYDKNSPGEDKNSTKKKSSSTYKLKKNKLKKIKTGNEIDLKYHKMHHLNSNEINKNLKKGFIMEPTCTKYSPKLDYIWSNFNSGAKWKTAAGRKYKEPEIDYKNFYITHEDISKTNKHIYIEMGKKTMRSGFPGNDLRLRYESKYVPNSTFLSQKGSDQENEKCQTKENNKENNKNNENNKDTNFAIKEEVENLSEANMNINENANVEGNDNIQIENSSNYIQNSEANKEMIFGNSNSSIPIINNSNAQMSGSIINNSNNVVNNTSPVKCNNSPNQNQEKGSTTSLFKNTTNSRKRNFPNRSPETKMHLSSSTSNMGSTLPYRSTLNNLYNVLLSPSELYFKKKVKIVPDFKHSVSRDQNNKRYQSEYESPLLNPNYQSVYPNPISLVTYETTKTSPKKVKNIKGVDYTLNNKVEDYFNLYNNHRECLVHDFKSYVPRPMDDNDPIPMFMKKMFTRSSGYGMNADSLKLNNFAEGKFIDPFSSFYPKKSFNSMINSMTNFKGVNGNDNNNEGDEYINSSNSSRNDFYSSEMKKLGSYFRKNKGFYSKNLDLLNDDKEFYKFDPITYKTICKSGSTGGLFTPKNGQRDIKSFLNNLKMKN